jgi:hypothetical protein
MLGRLLLAVAIAAPVLPARADDETLATGRELTADFHGERYDALWELMTGKMREALKSETALR